MTLPIKIAVSHPTGNRNIRAALAAFQANGLLHSFWTGFAWESESFWTGVIPSSLRRELERRSFKGIPHDKIVQNRGRELARLAAQRLLGRIGGVQNLPLISADEIYPTHDGFMARQLCSDCGYNVVYAPIGGTHRTFERAKGLGLKLVLELSSVYFGFYRDLIREEADRMPAWAATLDDALVAVSKPRHDDEELEMADLLIVPSRFVEDSLRGAKVQSTLKPIVIPYGCPNPGPSNDTIRPRNDKLRLLFVGSLTQAKGLSYLFDAISSAHSIIDTTIVGSLRTRECRALNDALHKVRWYEHLPHEHILRLMTQCDVLVHPSLAEGMALVVGEAMSQGRTVIVTPNAGNDYLVQDGKTGIVVPVRDANAIEEALVTLANDRERLIWMSQNAHLKAITYTDEQYGKFLCSALISALS